MTDKQFRAFLLHCADQLGEAKDCMVQRLHDHKQDLQGDRMTVMDSEDCQEMFYPFDDLVHRLYDLIAMLEPTEDTPCKCMKPRDVAKTGEDLKKYQVIIKEIRAYDVLVDAENEVKAEDNAWKEMATEIEKYRWLSSIEAETEVFEVE